MHQIREPQLSFMLKFSIWRHANVLLRRLLFLFLGLWIGIPVFAKSHETGFLDRTITLEGVIYKYQVFIPDNWTPKQKWPVILFLHGSGERADDGLQQTDTGIGTAIRVDRTRIPAIVVMPQCRKNLWWVEPPMNDMAMATLEAATKEFHGDTSRTYCRVGRNLRRHSSTRCNS